MAIDCWELASIVGKASKDAVRDYLSMCGLDSPWETPESFMAACSARALASHQIRVAIEFKVDRASNRPTPTDLARTPARLQRAYSHLDLAILRQNSNPWDLIVDGIIEFKKHSSMTDDANLIQYMIDEKHILYGLLVLFANGSSAEGVENEIVRLTHKLSDSGKWARAPSKASPYEYPGFPNSGVEDRWWDICCLVALQAPTPVAERS
jgi:hypothetical protein